MHIYHEIVVRRIIFKAMISPSGDHTSSCACCGKNEGRWIKAKVEISAARTYVEVFCLMDMVVEGRLDNCYAVAVRIVGGWEAMGHDGL